MTTRRPEHAGDPEGRRICLFGGTFDPVHLGHIAAAGLAVRELALDQVRFLPCRISPHKLGTRSAAAGHRRAMLDLTIQGLDWAVVDRFDLEQPEPSYSWRTALAMRERFPEARLFWLVGGDQWDELPDWSRPELLAETLEFIVVRRGTEPKPRPGWTCHPLDAVHPASASAIRESVSSGLRAEWLAPGVAEYVRKHRLYDA